MKDNELFLISGTDYKEMTKELLRRASLLERIPSSDARIGLKPNLVSPSEADYGATTHPAVVAGIIEYLQEGGCTDIVMLEGSWVGDRTMDAVRACGYDELSETYQVPFLDMQKEKGVSLDCAGLTLSVCECVPKIDFLINVPVVKGHCQTKITCALKNLKGLIPNAEKRRFHSLGLHRPIAHLNAGIHQGFIVADNICGDLDCEDGGNPVVMNRVIAAADPVLLDAFVCRLLNYEVDEVPYIRLAEQLGAGCAELSAGRIVQLGRDGTERTLKPETISFPTRPKKLVTLMDAVEEVDSCSACYAYLVPALEMLQKEGLLEKLTEKICIGQGYRKKTGKLGVGSCTAAFAHTLRGCPPTETEMYEFLKNYITGESK